MMDDKINQQMQMQEMEDERLDLQQAFDELLEKNNELEKEHITLKEEFKGMDGQLAEFKAMKQEYDYSKFQIEELQQELRNAQNINDKIDDDL